MWLIPAGIVLMMIGMIASELPELTALSQETFLKVAVPLFNITGYGWATWALWDRRQYIRSFRSANRALFRFEFTPPEPSKSNYDDESFYIEGLELRNVRCFQHLELEFDRSGEPSPVTLLIGENSTGKSTILRALALGLCQEAEATALMRTLPGSLLTTGKKEGQITIKLRAGNSSARIVTRIEQHNGAERIRQSTSPGKFPWHQLFACGYGTHRSTEASLSFEEYDRQAALETLFDESAKLMNPEVVLLRQPKNRGRCLRKPC